MGKGKAGYPRCPNCRRVYRTDYCHYCKDTMSQEEWDENTKMHQDGYLALSVFGLVAVLIWSIWKYVQAV